MRSALRGILLLSFLVNILNVDAQIDVDSLYGFELKVDLKATPVKDQYESATCWAYAATSYVESELIRMGKGEFDLSEKFFINRDYYYQALDYVRWNGQKCFGSGAEAFNVLNRIGDSGIMLEADYSSGPFPNNDALDFAINKYVETIAENKERKRAEWSTGVESILNNYLGTLPAKFSYNGKDYTPIEFRDFLEFNTNDYINFSSFKHHALYEKFTLESPDNWEHCQYYNITLDEMTNLVFDALNKGYTVLWSGDFSEDYIDENLIVVPEPETDTYDVNGTDRDRLNQATDDDSDSPYPDLLSEIVNELSITSEMRQSAYDNYETTDDHCMHITGYLTDKNGTRYLKVKNSWGNELAHDGYIYMSETFFRYKTLNITVHKDVVSTDIREKLNLQE